MLRAFEYGGTQNKDVMAHRATEEKPLVGVGVMIMRDGRILLGKRKGAHGEGEYSFPGGHLEYMESFEECARRETLEECGIEIENLRFQLLANVKKYAPKHYVHIGLIADWKSGEPKILEPDKCESWAWYELGQLPEPLFEMSRITIEAHNQGKNYFDA
ncbi:MAG: NUDIX domain-containing protein [Candidatus Sungiibacteriota bacterium]